MIANLLRAALIMAAALWVYWPSLHGDWIMDDERFIIANPLLRDTTGLWKIWFEPGAAINYCPITFTVLWCEWHQWAADPLGYHIVSLTLHIISALLLWQLLEKLGLRLAWLGGLIFAIHPLNVESVAWCAELKNTLSLPAFLLAMGFYIDYERDRRPRDYYLALAFFFIAMLAKVTMAMFPVVILLYVWWRRGRITRTDLKASAPFFLISLILGLVTIWAYAVYAHRHQAPPIGAPDAVIARLLLVGQTIWIYLLQVAWPWTPLPMYPQWKVDPSSFGQYLPLLVLIALPFLLWKRNRAWSRAALLGLGFFVIMIAPFTGLTSTGNMAYTWVMDHFLYIPMIGPIALLVALLEKYEGRSRGLVRLAGRMIIIALLVLLASSARTYARAWSSPESLYNYTLRFNPGAWLAHHNLGITMARQGDLPSAIAEFKQALQLKPDSGVSHRNLALACQQMGRIREAIEHYRAALQLEPGDDASREQLRALEGPQSSR